MLERWLCHATYSLLVLAVVPTSASVLYVNANNSSPSLPYQDWASAATRIQDAVDAAAPGDTVLVTNGVYDAGGRTVKTGPLVNRVVVEKAIQLASVNGPEVTVIQGNQVPGVTNGDGAIRCVYLSSGATLSGFTLTNGATLAAGPDETLSSGGGIWCESKSAVVLNCKLIGNSAPYGGAAAGGSFNNCTLIGNSAFMGGAVRGGTFSNPALDNCALNNCTLSGNSSYYGGGSFGATLNNCFLGGNSAVDGGGVYGSTLNNCTLTGNSASDSGGGANKSALNNCIVYNNNAILTDPNYQQGTLNYCCTTPLPPGGTGNITNEPALAGVWRLSSSSPCRGAGSAAYTSGVDMDGEPWLNPPSIGCDEYHNGSVIGSLSVGIAAAWTNVAPGFAIDLQGLISGYASDSRWEFGDGTIVSNHLSISHAWLAVGAYSVVFRAYSDSYPGGVSASATINVLPAPVHYVDLNSPGPLAPYNSWSTAAANVQDAVDAASVAGALVMVTNGTYVDGIRTGGKDPSPNRVVVDKPVRVASVNGPEVTVINGSGVRCVYLSAAAGLSGFTLTNGYAGSGGGIWCESSSALVTNCVLGGNSALNYGGGAYQGTLESSTFINNAASFGGAVCGGSLRNCTISNNSVQSFGGGTYGGTLDNCTITRCQSSDVGGAAAYCTLNHCALIGNSAPECGGAVDCTLNSCILTSNRSVFIYGYGGYGGGSELSTLNNCVLFGNSADLRGGGASSCMMNNCTLSGNSVSSSQGSGGGAAGCTLNNCILYYNSASLGTNYDSTSTLNYCCTTPLPTTGVGNIVSEPAFVDPVGEDFHLRLASPCIDSGTNLSPLITSDLDGRGRPIDGNGDGIAAFDIGAFEYSYEGPPILTEQPTSQTVNMGSAVSFHTTALGLSPLAYQWRYDEVGVPDATNSLLSLDAVTASQAGSYDVVVTNALGSVTSQVAVLTVIDAAPQVTLQPLDQTVFTGSNVTFTVLASGSRPLFWQWLFDGAVIQDATNASLTLPGLATDQAGTYSVTVSNALGSVTSQPARLTVLSGPPLITLQPLGQAVFAGSNVTFTVAASGSLPLFCQWQLDGTPIAGATDPSLKLTAVTTNQAGVYSVILSNALGNATSAEALLVVRVPGLSYVWQDSPNPALPYASWDTAAHVIQDAVDVAADGARVLVTNGTYRTGGRTVGASLLLNRVAIQKAIRVESVNGPEVTIIEGAPASGGGLGDDAVRCASVGTNAVLSGFTLTNGYSSSTNAGWEDQRAGGVLGFFPSIITNCLITGNAAVIGGGSFRGIFYNCLFTGNSAMEGGAGASGSFYNCAILGNSAEQDGGGVSGGVLNNCTVSGNEALSGGGASECTLLNSIVYYNSAEVSTTNYDGAVVSGSNYTGGTLRFCCTTPLGTNGWGNISDEPGFLSPGANFRLQNNSPCINAGNNNYVMGATDLDGKPRIAGGTVDIGAYEFQSPTSLLSYAWLRRYSLSLNGSADFTDSDVDGMSNWQEWRAGTDPFDPRSVLRMLTPSAGAPGVIVRWQSVSGQAYFVERSTNLSMNPAFQTIATNIIGQAGETVYSDTSAAGVGPFYYRVSVR